MISAMGPLREHRWLTVAILVVVFLAGLSMHVERAVGWGFFILCFVVGSLGGLGFIWSRQRFRFYWNTQTKSRKRIAIAAIVLLYIVATIIANRHKPDEVFYDTVDVLSGLLLWGMYRIVSGFVDRVNDRLFKR
jgi:hypothetical protein